MSQDIFDVIDPAISGTELADILNDFKDAVVSGFSGTTRPAELDIGGNWIDTTNSPASWSFRVWTGTDDVEIFKIDLVTGVASVALAVDSFLVKKISGDTAGALIELIKRRVASSGQVLSGDVVGEVRMVGRTITAGNPVVAKMIWTATDDMTSTSYGGTFSFYSTPDGTNTLLEHMRFIDGLIETVLPHKLNAQILVAQSVATAATVVQLSATKVLVEMTGSTTTDIQGINSGHASKVVSIHNRSSAPVTLKHLNAAAAAADRIELPGAADFVLVPDSTATLYYSENDTYWKLVSTSDKVGGYVVERLYGVTQTWTAPANVTAIVVRAYSNVRGLNTEKAGLLDPYGAAYAWGLNTNGQIGDGTIVPKSSPVAVLGSQSFLRTYGNSVSGMSTYGINNLGAAYAWGLNANGQLGDASVVPKSSPVLVVGSQRYTALFPRDATVLAITSNGAAYSWGLNTNGQLGDGTVVPKSSPVAVLGSQRYAKLIPISGAAGNISVVGLNTTGAAYAWGINTNGQLGVGDVASRSSPIAVVGGLTFKDVQGSAVSSRYSFYGITTAGAVYSWGANTNSNLGVGDQFPRSSPVAVVGGLTFDKIFSSPKSETVMAITSAGALYAWGDNTNGQLGVGDTTNRSSPVAVLGGFTFSKVKVFRNSVYGLTADGTLYAWGANANGQLGLGDVTARSSPIIVVGGLKFVDVFFADGVTDQYTAYGMTVDGTVYGWGSNTNGTIGDGTVTHRSSPVAVLGAILANPIEDVRSLDLTVTGGATYTVTTGAGIATLGINPIGRDVYKVEIEYLQ